MNDSKEMSKHSHQYWKKSDPPKISVVTPSFNQAFYLEECLDSIFSQNYPNLECIIIDGGSTDESISIIRKHEKHIFYWHSKPDEGHYAAVNEGFQISSGEIMCWLNSDDMFHRKGLTVLVEVFSSHPDVEFLTGKRIGFNENGGRLSFGYESQRWWRDLLLDPECLLDPPLCIMQEATSWRRSLWEKAGAALNLQYKYAADFELWARFSRYAQLHSIDTTIAGFREWGNEQRSQTHRKDYNNECKQIIKREQSVELEVTFESPPPLICYPLHLNDSPPKSTFAPKDLASYIISPDNRYPKISIVTPSFNQGRYLEECIDSVLAQKWPNLEYVIIDGGSTDDSVQIIKKYEKHLTYWQSEPDEGQYFAINEGFKKTSGDIMAWLNADDKHYPDCFVMTTGAFVLCPEVEWLTGRPSAYREDGEPLWSDMCVPRYCRQLYLEKKYDAPWIQQESVFWKRSLWEKAGGCLNNQYSLAADLELWTRFFRHAQLYTINHIISGFRVHSESRSSLHMCRYIREAERIILRELEEMGRGRYTDILPLPRPIFSLDPEENERMSLEVIEQEKEAERHEMAMKGAL